MIDPLFYFNLNPTSVATALGTVVPHQARTTVFDVIEHGRDFLGADPSNTADRFVHRAVQAALRELVNSHQWLYYYTHGRIQGHGFFTNGTIQYQDTSGFVPRLVTLTPDTTGLTWPPWANLGFIRLGSVTTNNLAATGLGTVIFNVDQVLSPTQLTLKAGFTSTSANIGQNKSADLPPGTSFTLFQDTYDLPTDFVNTDQGFADVSWGGMEYVHPNRWLQVNRYYQSYSNTPRFYTIMGSETSPNRLSWRIFPFPEQDRTLDFVYKRRPRFATLDQYTTGIVSAFVSSGNQFIYGNGTNWTASMQGSVIRLSSQVNAAVLPTGWEGSNPYAQGGLERNIVAVISPTQVQVDDTIPATLTNVAYRISDPIDVEETAMLEAYLRCVEKHIALLTNMKEAAMRASYYEQALLFAKDADARSFATRQAGVGGPYRQRLANMPRGPDIS